jgi:CRISPR-associated endonuclease/helicase Cas3
LLLHRVEDRRRERKPDLYTCVDEGECKRVPLPQGPRCSAWQPLQTPLMALQTMAEARSITLDACARRFATLQAPDSGQGWLYHPWLGLTQKY